MTLDEAIVLLKKTVKENGTTDQKHIDLGLVPTDELAIYQEAVVVTQKAIRKGEISMDDFKRKVALD